MLFKDHFHKQLNNKITTCEACPLKNNRGPILGYGSLEADVMFIGDYPDESDFAASIPFTGKGWKIFNKALETAELKKGEYYLTYMMKHMPSNDVSSIMNNKACLNILLEEIELINPRVICTAGAYVTRVLMKEYKLKDMYKNLNDFHGKGLIIPGIMKHKKIIRPMRYLIPTWSPRAKQSLAQIQFSEDVYTISAVRKLGIILYSYANITTN